MFRAHFADDSLANYVGLLPTIFRTYGIDKEALKVMDCYCGDGELVYLLMEQFNIVGSNDPNPFSASPNKLALADVNLWKMIESNYNSIVTRMNDEEQISCILQNMPFCQSSMVVIALLVPHNVRPCLRCKSVDIEIAGFKYKWQFLFPNLTIKLKYNSMKYSTSVINIGKQR